VGNATFFSRFLIQWYATERQRKVVIPPAFWWLSLIGSGLLLSYALFRRDSVFIFAYAFTWIPYVRNLMIHHGHKQLEEPCGQCTKIIPPGANYCPHCGQKAGATSAP
jgi:lipid-A-disaccharide synthase-like uncharacterized protein